MSFELGLQLLNVLLVPVLYGQIRLEHRLTKLEGLSRRVGVLERRAGIYGGPDDRNSF